MFFFTIEMVSFLKELDGTAIRKFKTVDYHAAISELLTVKNSFQ